MILNTMKNEIINYVEVKKLKKPMLIGHSLGAFMTLWLHSSKPDLFGKSICVDGLPFISAINNPLATSESVKNNPQMDKQTTIKNFIALANEGT